MHPAFPASIPLRRAVRALGALVLLLGAFAGAAGEASSGAAAEHSSGAAGGAVSGDSETGGASRWRSPLRTPFIVTGAYRAPPHPYGSGHRGIDLSTTLGATVVAPVGGTVTFSGPVAGRDVVSVRVDARTVLSIEPVSSTLQRGDGVVPGAVLGSVGAGGHCVGATGAVECIHLGVRVDGDYVNPLRYFLGRPRLVPW